MRTNRHPVRGRSESTTVAGRSRREIVTTLFLMSAASVLGQTVSSFGNATSCLDLKPGIVVETVAKNSGAEKAGLAKGDVILAWTRGDLKGDIPSPFDLPEVELEQGARGQVSLEGTREETRRTWTMGPTRWNVVTRPNLQQPLLKIYLEGQELAEAGKLAEATEHWRNATGLVPNGECAWLDAWFIYHAAGAAAKVRQWKESDALYQEAVDGATSRAVSPRITAQVFRAWSQALAGRNDWLGVKERENQVLAESQKLDRESLSIAKSLAILGVALRHLGDFAKGEEYERRALTIMEKLAPGSIPVASCLNDLGAISFDRGELTEAEDLYVQALGIRERLIPGSIDVAGNYHNLGNVALIRGDLAKSEEYYEQSLALMQEIAPGSNDLAGSLTMLGNVASLRGDLAKAEDYQRRALAIYEKLSPDSPVVAQNLMNLGIVLDLRGELTRAEECYVRAQGILQRTAPQSTDVAEVLVSLGDLARDNGQLNKAEGYQNRALAILEKVAPESELRATSMIDLGTVASDRGDFGKAEEYYRQARVLEEKLAPGSLALAEIFNNLGEVAYRRGDLSAAKEYYGEGLEIFAKLAPNSADRAVALASLAETLRDEKKFDEAAKLYAQALDVFDQQLTLLGGSDEARATFRAKQAGYYSDYADLMVSEKRSAAAFEVLERSRARTMVELLAGSRIDIRHGTDPALVAKERLLQATLTAKTSRKVTLLEGEHTPEQLASLNREIDETLSQYQELEGRIRARSPRYAALTQPKPLSANEAQQLLDPQTALVYYALGAKRSFVFVMTRSSLDSYQLLAREDIETTARRTYDLLTARNRPVTGENSEQRKARLAKEDGEYRSTSLRLSQMVLGPFIERLAGKRLVIVADGALQYIPFAALPIPAADSSKPTTVPLVAEHEIVNLPSASVLAVLRMHASDRGNLPTKEVAILADPVFDKTDPRVGKGQAPATPSGKEVAAELNFESTEHLTRSINDVDRGTPHAGVALPRLAFSRREAAAIMATAKPGEGMEALDFDASRETALSKELGQYRIVHFATHGLLDNEHPELSGLVLSLVDPDGKPRDGFLDLQDIYNLRIPADLVVLSACETGLGKEINGEGLVGLTRGFMYAGASRVVASLWKVDDVATSELMAEFYKGMLQAGLAPAAALRQAQLEMQKRKRWADPYYWAAFTLQGEWK